MKTHVRRQVFQFQECSFKNSQLKSLNTPCEYQESDGWSFTFREHGDFRELSTELYEEKVVRHDSPSRSKNALAAKLVTSKFVVRSLEAISSTFSSSRSRKGPEIQSINFASQLMSQ